MDREQWPPEWQRGFLEFVILHVVAAEPAPTYGYRIVQNLGDAGFGKVKGGTLYPILARLEASGLVASHWGDGDGGPGRKFIAITPAGQDRLADLSDQWRAFDAVVNSLVRKTQGAPS